MVQDFSRAVGPFDPNLILPHHHRRSVIVIQVETPESDHVAAKIGKDIEASPGCCVATFERLQDEASANPLSEVSCTVGFRPKQNAFVSDLLGRAFGLDTNVPVATKCCR
jgi:hypothetical protein